MNTLSRVGPSPPCTAALAPAMDCLDWWDSPNTTPAAFTSGDPPTPSVSSTVRPGMTAAPDQPTYPRRKSTATVAMARRIIRFIVAAPTDRGSEPLAPARMHQRGADRWLIHATRPTASAAELLTDVVTRHQHQTRTHWTLC